MSLSRVDEHTMCLYFCVLEESDILNAITKALSTYEKKCKQRFSSTFKLNVIRDKEGIPYGYGYLYVSNPKVYHLFLGHNPDGSERKQIIDRSAEYGVDLNDYDFWNKPIGDWADYAEALEEVDLEPLVQPDPVMYSERHQTGLEKFKKRSLAKGKKLEDLDYWYDDRAVLEFQPAVVKDVDISLEPHKLFAKDIPDWITERMIQQRFQNFVQGKFSNYRKNRRSKESKYDQYPKVSINKRLRTCIVEFNCETRDAQFALLMAKTLSFNSNQRSNVKYKHILYFTHMKKIKNQSKSNTFSKRPRSKRK